MLITWINLTSLNANFKLQLIEPLIKDSQEIEKFTSNCDAPPTSNKSKSNQSPLKSQTTEQSKRAIPADTWTETSSALLLSGETYRKFIFPSVSK